MKIVGKFVFSLLILALGGRHGATLPVAAAADTSLFFPSDMAVFSFLQLSVDSSDFYASTTLGLVHSNGRLVGTSATFFSCLTGSRF